MIDVALELGPDRTLLVVDEASPPDPAGTGRRTEFDVEMCTSPLCHCRDVEFVERADRGAEAERRHFRVDPFARALVDPDPALAAGADELPRRVVAAFGTETWQALLRAFFAVKARAIAAIDCEREEAVFPFDEVERDGVMVPYRGTIPFDAEITVTDGSRRLLVDDQYCVRLGCGCNDVFLAVLLIDPAPGPDGTRTADEIAAMTVDLAAESWRDPDHGGPLSEEQLELRRLILGSHPTLLATLGRRQRVIRALYRSAAARAGWAERAAPAPVVVAPRPGRNDPCPCGSGKKFKKCCLRA